MRVDAGLRAQRIAILAAGLVLLAVAFLTPGDSGRESVPPSTYYAGEGGAKALYLAAAELGLDVERWNRSTADLLVDSPAVLVVLAPSEPFERAEAESLAEWVEEGGRLVYVAAERGDNVLDALELRLRFGDELVRASELSPSAQELVQDSPTALDSRRLSLDPTRLDDSDALGSCEPLYVDEQGNAGLAVVRRGAGHALVIADATGLTNDTLAESEIALIVLRALARDAAPNEKDGAVAFEEYHHGFREGEGIAAASLDWLLGSHAGWSVLALCALGFTALVTSGLRHGSALPPPPKPRRSSLEHVVALADAYERSRARGRPARELAMGLRLALGGGDLEASLALLRAADPSIAADADLVLAATSGSVDLVELTGAIDRVRAVAERARRSTRSPIGGVTA